MNKGAVTHLVLELIYKSGLIYCSKKVVILGSEHFH